MELGLKFRTDVPGVVTGVRFYKAVSNTGTHVGHLWTRAGALLGTVTFSAETGSGWQEASFDTPVPIDAGTTYVISYYAPGGHYAGDNGYFASAGVDSGPLHALADGVDGGNGVYRYGAGGGFPSSSWQASNYWVDVVFSTGTTDTSPPTVTAVSPPQGASGIATTTTVTATFSEAIDPLTVRTDTFQLFDPSNNAVLGSVTYNSATRTAFLAPTVPLVAATTYRAVVRGGTVDPRVKDPAGNALAADYAWSFTTAAPPPPPGTCPCSLWSNAAFPAVADSGPDSPVELGVKFRADASGYITGLRFYKSLGNVGTHVASLWSSAGDLLASATVTGESASGWQQVEFSPPVPVAANTTYVASYHANSGHYSFDQRYFASTGVDNAPLHAPANGVVGANGVFAYGATSTFPTSGYNATNYWVDVVFAYTAEDKTPPTVTVVSPTAGAVGVSVGTAVSVTFNEELDASTVTGSTFFLRDPSNTVVAASVAYTVGSRTARLSPNVELQPLTVYTATVVGGSSAPHVTDVAGNPLAASTTWSFTTGGLPPSEGPGGPILVISNASNPFSRYYAEILRAEGLNEFTVTDIANVSSTVLNGYDVAILGNFALTAAQVTMLGNWVTAGGNLIAMRPDKQLAALLGLTDTSTTLSNAYLLVNTASGPGAGLVNQTIQFHGTADRYGLNGAASLATLYSNATTATTAPAVTLRGVGAGQAAAFTYDLARSVVYTRQGNPSWSGVERDGSPPIRSDDLFYGASATDPQPDWINLAKVAIPQADEQQRLLANLILKMNQVKKPLPRFWYLPRDLKAVVVMTGDDHGNNGTAGRFDAELARSPQGCSVADWQCIRSTSYIYPSTPLDNAQAASYVAQGFEVAVHFTTNCVDWTPAQLELFYTDQLAAWSPVFSSLPSPSTSRTHCIVWSDYDTQPQVELSHGIRFDTNYYFWPPGWVNDRPGLFTGSGMPMRLTTRDGQLLDVYEGVTQMTDESGQSYPFTIDTLLDNALGAQGYYGAFVANMHNDVATTVEWDDVVTSAQSRGVPVISALQMLRWLDGRNGSSFSTLTWNGSVLDFSISVGAGANGLRAMLPVNAASSALTSITRDGIPVAYSTSVVKGIQYAVFAAAAGAYKATYGGAMATATLAPTTVVFADQQLGTTSAAQAVVLTNTGSVPLTIASIAVSGDYSQTNNCGTTLAAGTPCTINVSFSPIAAGSRPGTLTVSDNGAGSPRTVTLSGTGTGTLPSATWFAGDMHVHRSCGGSPEALSSLLTKMGTNDLSAISLLADMGNGEVQDPITDLPRVNGADDPISTSGRIVHWDAEWHWDATYTQYAHQALGGHVVALGLTEAHQIWQEYTAPIFDWAHQQGGIAGFVHMQYLGTGIPDGLTCCTPVEYPVEVALGTADFIAEDVTGGDSAIDAYYRLLNTGFRPALAAGSDYPCGVNTLGPLLTYVRIPDGQMTYRKWIDGIAGRRTVVSRNGNNEFVELKVNGSATPGDEVQLTSGGSVPVTIQWTSKQSRTGTIELVKNGEVVASWTASAGPGAPANTTTAVDFAKSGWLAARRMGADGHVVHTGAVFVIVGNAPVRVSVADAQFYVQWMDTLLARTAPGGVWSSYFPTQRAAAQARYQAAKAVFQQRAADAAGGAAVTLSPTSVTFGAQAVGTTSAPQAVTLTNTGGAPLTISGIAITGAQPGDYAETSTCPLSPATLAAGANCTISVTFKPTATGARAATLTVTDNATGSPHSVGLTGTGGAPVVSLSATALSFGNQRVGTTSTVRSITLSNTGNAVLAISSIVITGANAGDFSRTTTCGATLAAGSSCTISVRFAPTALGARTGEVTITDNAAGSPHVITLTGTGIAAVTVSPTSLSFATRLIGTTSSSSRVTLTNNGSGPLTITSIGIAGVNATDFALTTTCGSSLAAGTNCRINVTFTPRAAFGRTATLTISDSDPSSPQLVSLSGTGTAVSLSTRSLSFAARAVGTTSAARSVTVRNAGSVPLPIQGISITGANSGDFAQTNNCGTSVAAGASCTISITFRPTASGSRTAAVTISDTDPTSPQTITLTGTGQ